MSDPSTPYEVPSNGDEVTGWQINTDTADATPGANVTLVVLHVTGADTYDVVGADAETLPNPLPAGGIASFTLANPIVAAAGDKLGLYSTTPDGVDCFFSGTGTPAGASLNVVDDPAPPAAGQHLTVDPGIGESPPGYEMNVAATIAPATEDVAAATAVSPANVTAGNLALLASTVGNAGPGTRPITFTDTVPAGLTIVSAAAGNGSCTVAGQTVTCTITGLAAGQNAPVNVVVSTGAPGSYANAVAVRSGATDPNPANNAASVSLVVSAAPTPAPTPKCVVPNLKRVPSSTAKKLLKLLGCKAGKTRKAHSSSVAKGLVIKTSPKAGTYAANRTINLTVSSGKAKKKR